MRRLLILAHLLIWATVGSVRAEPAAFPVTVAHALGTTTISGPPKRIVTLGWSVQDAVFALGFAPVAMPKHDMTQDGLLPWDAPFLAGRNITLLQPGLIDFEEIAALRPDLILAVRSGVDAVSFQRLSRIASTVVYQSGPWIAGWQEQTLVAGAALGVADKARALVEKTGDFLKGLGAQYPVLKDRSFVFGTYFKGASGIVVYLPADPRVAALNALGMKNPAFVEELGAANPGKFSASLSFEQSDRIDADLLVMWYGEGTRQAAEAQPLFHTIASVRQGGYVALDDPASVWSTSALSVLSIPYGFPRFVPRLAEAAERVARQRSE